MEEKQKFVADRIKELTKESLNGVVVATLVDDLTREYDLKIEKMDKS